MLVYCNGSADNFLRGWFVHGKDSIIGLVILRKVMKEGGAGCGWMNSNICLFS